MHLRAAVSEAAAQSMPIHALRRPGATEAAAEFDELLARVVPLSDLAEMGADDPGAVDASEAPPFMERSA